MNYANRVGSQWGKLTIKRIFREPMMLEGMDFSGNKFMYDSGHFKAEKWDLECLCGELFTIKVKEFPGRREMSCCAKCSSAEVKEEGVKQAVQVAQAVLGRPTKREKANRKRVVQVYMEIELEDRVQAYADSSNLSFSKAAAVLLRMALKAITAGDAEIVEPVVAAELVAEPDEGPVRKKSKPWLTGGGEEN